MTKHEALTEAGKLWRDARVWTRPRIIDGESRPVRCVGAMERRDVDPRRPEWGSSDMRVAYGTGPSWETALEDAKRRKAGGS